MFYFVQHGKLRESTSLGIHESDKHEGVVECMLGIEFVNIHATKLVKHYVKEECWN